MNLTNIIISNYRSIEKLDIEVLQLDDRTKTFGLIGVNEAGKSTILKAIALKEEIKDGSGNMLPLKKDFKNKDKPIEIVFRYEISDSDIQEIIQEISTLETPVEISKESLKHINAIYSFSPSAPQTCIKEINLSDIEDSNESKALIQEAIKEVILKRIHKAIFWTSEDRYLMSQPVNITQFASSPETVSIPLRNCFLLSGINNIQERINSILGDSTEIEQLEKELSKKVTEHINNVWIKHPISITFKIGDGLINFHINDENSTGKAKTADQRSDGFKQFISFLLTVSAQSKNEELSNAILLLDEPETHLHPQAQEDLLKELVKITQNNGANVIYFATHSNFMIDKNNLSRNFKVTKDDSGTKIFIIDSNSSSYAGVNYEVFGIDSMDYHNEIYDKLREKYSVSIQKDDIGIIEFDTGFFQHEHKLKTTHPYKQKQDKVTLPTYVRNSIHYPQNKTKEFPKLLEESIKLLKQYE